MTVVLSNSAVREKYEAGLAELRRQFDCSGIGEAVVRGRSHLVDEIIAGCYQQLGSQGINPSDCVAIVALGGYGRATLLPQSDVDLLFLFKDTRQELAHKDALSRIYLELWDLKIRASATARTVAECGKLDPQNFEFTVSLLDSRFLVGNHSLFDEVQRKVLPGLLKKSGNRLVVHVAESARIRHAKYADTIYHLEPHVKEGPGGLRDYNLACWLALAAAFRESGSWPEPTSLFDPRLEKELEAAFNFFVSVRCFLHYRNGRDDNTLSWEAQDAAAGNGIGIHDSHLGSSQWMREYFRNARTIYGAAVQLMLDSSSRKTSLGRRLQPWRSKPADGISIIDGTLILGGNGALKTVADALSIFQRMARERIRLGIDAQRIMVDAVRKWDGSNLETALWPALRQIFTGPHAGNALRAMRDCGLLDLLIPEFKLIDALVVRDFFHRYTVDEHSLLTIETLHALKDSKAEWDKHFAEILAELEKPELLFLALLLHDFGKGLEGEDHVSASMRTASNVVSRLLTEAQERETVLFLIRNHLEMSAAMRRDIFDARVIGALAAKVITPEALKMLTLLTYADISSVNPEAMTPWKAENLWHLYVSTSNFLNRHVDEERLHRALHTQIRAKFEALSPRLMRELEPFLEGLPQRYLGLHSAEQIIRHSELASRLWQEPVQTLLASTRDLYELTIITKDKPSLFATLAGTLSAWGMEIVKANAFSNSSGIVVDSFAFKDRFRTLDLNPSEHERLKKSIAEIVRGDRALDQLIRARSGFKRSTPVRVQVETKILFDDESSTHSTLLEIVAQDRPGLLYKMSQALAELGCNIEIALIDTEGDMALDVFYLTAKGRKLTFDLQESVRETISAKLRSS